MRRTRATSEHVLEVWCYEAYRLFRDRLVGADARNRFDNIMATVVRSEWSANVIDNLTCKCLRVYSVKRFHLHLQRHKHVSLVIGPCYRPQTKLREGYVFTGVCHSVNRGGCVSQHALQV